MNSFRSPSCRLSSFFFGGRVFNYIERHTGTRFEVFLRSKRMGMGQREREQLPSQLQLPAGSHGQGAYRDKCPYCGQDDWELRILFVFFATHALGLLTCAYDLRGYSLY